MLWNDHASMTISMILTEDTAVSTRTLKLKVSFHAGRFALGPPLIRSYGEGRFTNLLIELNCVHVHFSVIMPVVFNHGQL